MMHRLLSRIPFIALAVAGLLISAPAHAQAHNPARLAQLVDYVGVDYSAAVENGEVISAFEYGEMQEFTGLIEEQVLELPDDDARAQLLPLAARLRDAVNVKAEPGDVAAIARQMTEILLTSPALSATPDATPDLASAAGIYVQQCASCHGATGHGDGAAVTADMEPAPTDFTDIERAHARSLYGLYNTITLGVEGTAMPSFEHLSPAQRWALAFYVGSLHADDATLRAGEQTVAAMPSSLLPDMNTLTTSTLDVVRARGGETAVSIHAWLRRHPELIMDVQRDPLAVAIAGIRESMDIYASGDADAAHDAAVDAYLEGFELAEAALSTTQADLVLDVETAMTNLRQAIRQQRPEGDVRAAGEQVLALLQQARDSQDGESLSSGVAFTSALIILLREGLEAILVLGAIAAFLNKTGRRDAMPWLHGGWIGALAVGVLTWVVSNYIVTISGATREITEGATALIAAGVLFYVGFWMHSKLNARRWQEFIQHSVQSALDHRGLWAIAGIAFIAVYREVFETVLFFQALWAQVTVPAAQSAMFTGAIAGAVIIVGVAWAIFRFGVRLPLKQFFGATAAIMIALAVIFAGKGVAALQEAGTLPLDPITFPRVELLGIYPTLQSIGVQLAVLAAALALIVYNARSSRTASAQG